MGDFESSYCLSSEFLVDAPLLRFKGKNDISSLSFVGASPFETSISMDTSKDVPIISNAPLPLSSSRERKEGNKLKNDASFDLQCIRDIFVESEHIFIEEDSVEELYVVELSELISPMKLVDHIHVESFLDICPTPYFAAFFPSVLHSSLDPLESTFEEFETFMPSSHCIDQTLDDIHTKRL